MTLRWNTILGSQPLPGHDLDKEILGVKGVWLLEDVASNMIVIVPSKQR